MRWAKNRYTKIGVVKTNLVEVKDFFTYNSRHGMSRSRPVRHSKPPPRRDLV